MTHLRTGARPLHQHTTQFPSCAEPDFGLGFTAPSPKPLYLQGVETIALWSFEVRAIRKVLDLELCVLELGGSCEVPASTRPLRKSKRSGRSGNARRNYSRDVHCRLEGSVGQGKKLHSTSQETWQNMDLREVACGCGTQSKTDTQSHALTPVLSRIRDRDEFYRVFVRAIARYHNAVHSCVAIAKLASSRLQSLDVLWHCQEKFGMSLQSALSPG